MGIDLGKLLNDAVKEVSGFIDKTGKEITKAIAAEKRGRWI